MPTERAYRARYRCQCTLFTHKHTTTCTQTHTKTYAPTLILNTIGRRRCCWPMTMTTTTTTSDLGALLAVCLDAAGGASTACGHHKQLAQSSPVVSVTNTQFSHHHQPRSSLSSISMRYLVMESQPNRADTQYILRSIPHQLRWQRHSHTFGVGMDACIICGTRK